MMEENHLTMTTRMTSIPMGEWSGMSVLLSNASIDIAIVSGRWVDNYSQRRGINARGRRGIDDAVHQGMRGMRHRDRRL
jgi:hypothetical protein